MDALQLYHYTMCFELKLRRTAGIPFQDFVSTVLERANGADFVRVRAFGSLGDKGCDGYLPSSGRVYQCYGKLHDAALSAATIVGKIGADFELAKRHLKSIMREWHFAHNLVDGVPTEVVTKIEELKAANPSLKIGLLGPAALKNIVLGLDPVDLVELLGPAASAEDSRNLNIQEVRDAVDAIITSIDNRPITSPIIRPVPAAKLTFNNLPTHWVHLIEIGSKNAPHVREYFERHPKADTGEVVAKEFTRRYQTLKLEGLAPGEIMTGLYQSITGLGVSGPDRQIAAYALLAYLFDACEIFEDHPQVVTVLT